jgi:Zn-dependent peptidase ImmA (M78 family)
LVIDRLKSMRLLDTDRQRVLVALSSDAAAGYSALAQYKGGINEGWLARQGFSRKDAEDVAFSGTSRHPIVGLLRSSRGSSLSIDDYDLILKMLRPSDLKSFHRLREVAKGLNSPIDIREPWESGYQLARLVREKLRKSPSEYFDIENEVGNSGVEIHDIELPDIDILGVCIGTPTYVPLILLNRSCDDASGVSGRRVTLAHEWCHLLFDRAGLRSLARIEGGAAADSDRLMEMRANAFAVELLVRMATLVDPSGAVLGDEQLQEISRAQKVSLVALQRHAGNLRNRLSKR